MVCAAEYVGLFCTLRTDIIALRFPHSITLLSVPSMLSTDLFSLDVRVTNDRVILGPGSSTNGGSRRCGGITSAQGNHIARLVTCSVQMACVIAKRRLSA